MISSQKKSRKFKNELIVLYARFFFTKFTSISAYTTRKYECINVYQELHQVEYLLCTTYKHGQVVFVNV